MTKRLIRIRVLSWLGTAAIVTAIATMVTIFLLTGLDYLISRVQLAPALCAWSAVTFERFFVPLVDFAASIVRLFVPWPAVALAFLIVLARSPTPFIFFMSIFRAFKRVSFFGADIELNSDIKKQVQTTAQDVSAATFAYREQIISTVRRQVELLEIDGELSKFVETELESYFKWKELPDNFRCTFHVQDFVFKDHLMQLLDYSPSGSGAGRSFSIRYGIIGKVWRSGSSKLVGTLLEKKLETLDEKSRISHITEEWGMTRAEAKKVMSRPSYACLPVRNAENERVALFYMDSTQKNAFQTNKPGSAPDELDQITLGEIESRLKNSKLPAKIAKLQERMTGAYLLISIAESK